MSDWSKHTHFHAGEESGDLEVKTCVLFVLLSSFLCQILSIGERSGKPVQQPDSPITKLYGYNFTVSLKYATSRVNKNIYFDGSMLLLNHADGYFQPLPFSQSVAPCICRVFPTGALCDATPQGFVSPPRIFHLLGKHVNH